MSICVLGGTGLLGHEMKKLLYDKKAYFLGRKDVDITEIDKLYQILSDMKPKIIIHAAAYTDIDHCESRKEHAIRVNATGTANVAKLAADLNAKLLYVSSDHVFDGLKGSPYNIEDKPNPINVYGLSKYLGEQEVEKLMDKYFIVRTAGLYGDYGKSLVKALLNLTKSNSLINAIEDQRASTTYGFHLAEAILKLMDGESYGKYHFVNEGSCSWFEFAQEICRLKGINAKVYPIKSSQLIGKAKKPKNSILCNSSSIKLKHWKDALDEYLYSIEYRYHEVTI
ncbi:dTDP-4-dehydrorhamnose reductase [Alkaliphilus serpentinus]|uniref:dTDP-4-dehydrorhamnose reductase n=1 Tax=Alkaliphilus serpentinus TaxID=1482731 RepID=A0A833HML2_9FIRM|nr:dTDP-4-dehydrorhamnose reductase [Alkaliphilus serpentinus]KAB3527634.1 dTDP-4-dehydrorhamnose reductase [Alkaliphilus serpentinus]